VFACLGLYSATPTGAFVPGLECAGVVDETGPGVSGARPGDRVIALTRFGGYATALNVDARYLVPLPEGWTDAQGAAHLVQALTAWYGLVSLGTLARDGVVLVHSAAGGVGLQALAMAQSIGARIVATVGHAAKLPLLEERGLASHQVIVREASLFGDQLDRALGGLGARGLDVVFDAIAGPYFLPALSRLRPEGRYVIYGAADFMPAGTRPNWARLAWQYARRPRLDPMKLIDRNRSVMGFNLIWLFERANRLSEASAAALRLSPAPPYIGARFAFDELPSALRALQGGRTTGKVIVDV
jgi:alcohol dehydrogenase